MPNQNLRQRTLRKTFHLSLIGILAVLQIMTPPTASAGWLPRFNSPSRPSKVRTCEMMLKGPLAQLAHKGSVLSTVRDLRFQIEKAHSLPDNDGRVYLSLSYDGPLKKISKFKAWLLTQRLLAIEHDLIEKPLDQQIVTLEFRGPDILKALEQLESNEPHIEQVYAQAKKTFYETGTVPQWYQALNYSMAGFTVFVALALTGLVVNHIFFDTPLATNPVQTGFIAFGAVNCWSVIWEFFRFEKLRLFEMYSNMKSRLRDQVENPTQQNLFVSSLGLNMPSEFHRYLMTTEENTWSSESIEAARKLAVQAHGAGELNYIETLNIDKKLLDESVLQRLTQNAGDLNRTVYLDQFVFTDSSTNEPVWLIVYRAFQNRPPGKKPTRKKSAPAPQKEILFPGVTAPSS